MQQEDFDKWEQFEERLRQLTGERDELVKQSAPLHVSSFLFRGQGNQSWPLQTTLERAGKQPWTFWKYFRLIHVARSQIETFTELTWDIEDTEELRQWSSEYDNICKKYPAYAYQIYLRHHGFPSPLLDWTRSPYVAAYFAFAKPSCERVAIHAYMEYTGSAKGRSSSEPLIRSLGPYVRSHSRHFLQQSEYTIAAEFVENKWTFVSHEDVFDKAPDWQDRLWKFTLPITERLKVLRTLDAYNLNAFSLFQHEESLLRTISLREIELSKDEA